MVGAAGSGQGGRAPRCRSLMGPQGILITGGTGQLGTELLRRDWPAEFEAVAIGSDDLDFRDTYSIDEAVANGHLGQPWAAIINGAAYTAVDKAESEPLEAWRINALAPAALSVACARNNIPLVHVSTDYVFGGSKMSAWEVDDPLGPLNVYGASKLGGELAVRTSGARHAIVRTSWVVSAHGKNFVKTMLQLASSRSRLGIVADQRGSPTSAADLASALMAITLALAKNESAGEGVFHFSNAGSTTWAEFAAEIFRQSALRAGPSAEVDAISTLDFPTPARRPQNSLLSHSAITDAFGLVPRPWQDALADILDELIGEIE